MRSLHQSLLILREIMEEMQRNAGLPEVPLPSEHFDLIGGTKTGGIIALMLGRLGMVCVQYNVLDPFAQLVVGRRLYPRVY